MDGYSELKREQEKNTKRLKEANSKSDELDIKTQEIKEILNNLKSPLLDKNNKIISNENIDKFLNYTEEVKDITKSIKGVNDLNITIDKVEKNYKNLESERDRLYYSNTEKDKKAEYSTMLMDGTLNSHLKEIQETATERVEQIIKQLKAKSNLTEDMKNTDMLYWVGMMNNFKNQAEEIIFNELINV